MGPEDLRGLSDDGLASFDSAQVRLLTLRSELLRVREQLEQQQELTRKLTHDAQERDREHRADIDRCADEVGKHSTLAAKRGRQIVALCEVIEALAQRMGRTDFQDPGASDRVLNWEEWVAVMECLKVGRESVV